jgi:pantoate--beta-alanine ligase
LLRAQALYDDGVRDADAIRSAMNGALGAEPLAQVDYVSVADTESLQELERIEDKALVSLAVRIGKTRLIDNVTLGDSQAES